MTQKLYEVDVLDHVEIRLSDGKKTICENVDASTDGSRDGRRGGSVSCCAGSHSIPQG